MLKVKELHHTTVSELFKAVKTQDNIMRLLDRCTPYLESSGMSVLLIYGDSREIVDYLDQRTIYFTELLPTNSIRMCVSVDKTCVRVIVSKQEGEKV